MLRRMLWPLWRYVRYSEIGVWCHAQIPKYNRPPALKFKPCELTKVGLIRDYDCAPASLAQVTYKCQRDIHMERHFLNIREKFDESEKVESLQKYGHRGEGYHEKFYRHIYKDMGFVRKKYWFPRDITSMWHKHGDLIVSFRNHLVPAHSGVVYDMPKNYYLIFRYKKLNEKRTKTARVFWILSESHKQICEANHKKFTDKKPQADENPFRKINHR